MVDTPEIQNEDTPMVEETQDEHLGDSEIQYAIPHIHQRVCEYPGERSACFDCMMIAYFAFASLSLKRTEDDLSSITVTFNRRTCDWKLPSPTDRPKGGSLFEFIEELKWLARDCPNDRPVDRLHPIRLLKFVFALDPVRIFESRVPDDHPDAPQPEDRSANIVPPEMVFTGEEWELFKSGEMPWLEMSRKVSASDGPRMNYFDYMRVSRTWSIAEEEEIGLWARLPDPDLVRLMDEQHAKIKEMNRQAIRYDGASWWQADKADKTWVFDGLSKPQRLRIAVMQRLAVKMMELMPQAVNEWEQCASENLPSSARKSRHAFKDYRRQQRRSE